MVLDTDTRDERGRTVRPSAPDAAGESDRRGRLLQGAEGGFLATIVMTAYRLPVTRSLPPSAEFWTKYVSGGDPEDHPVPALALHILYGVASGVVFAALLPGREPVDAESDTGPPSRADEPSTTAYGLLYGVALSVFGEYVVLDALLDVDPDDRFAFHVGHVVYGITLGAWVGTRTRDEG